MGSGPLHWRAHPVAIPEERIVAHADLVAVIDDRRAVQGKQQAVEQLDAASVTVQQGCETTIAFCTSEHDWTFSHHLKPDRNCRLSGRAPRSDCEPRLI